MPRRRLSKVCSRKFVDEETYPIQRIYQKLLKTYKILPKFTDKRFQETSIHLWQLNKSDLKKDLASLTIYRSERSILGKIPSLKSIF